MTLPERETESLKRDEDPITMPASLPARGARALIFLYRVSFSALIGRQCRYLPSCSEYTDEAICRHGLWAGGWMGLARLCRCRPGAGEGFDPVPTDTPRLAGALTPWRYGAWRRPPVCEAVEPTDQERAINSTAKP